MGIVSTRTNCGESPVFKQADGEKLAMHKMYESPNFQQLMGIVSTRTNCGESPVFEQADGEKLAMHKMYESPNFQQQMWIVSTRMNCGESKVFEQTDGEFSGNDTSLAFLENLPIYATIFVIGGTQRRLNSGSQLKLFSPNRFIVLSFLANFSFNLEWYKVVTLDNNSSNFGPRRGFQSVVFNNKI